MSTQPLNFAETPVGNLLMAAGLNPLLRWDGLSAPAATVGLTAPTQAVTLGSSGFGTGQIFATQGYYAYVRFLDAQGNPSNFSPIAGPLLPAALPTGTVQGFTNNTPLVIQTNNHGLQTGAVITLTGIGGTIA